MYENPYIKYAYKKLTSKEFIDIAIKEFPNSFIRYCEIVILRNGMIELAVPSHQKTLIRLTGKTEQELPVDYFEEYLLKKSGAIAVWYKTQKAYSVNRFQLRTLDLLCENGLIEKDLHIVNDFIKGRLMKMIKPEVNNMIFDTASDESVIVPDDELFIINSREHLRRNTKRRNTINNNYKGEIVNDRRNL